MKAQLATLCALAAAVIAAPQATTSEFDTLLASCNNGGANTFVAVDYGGSTGIMNFSFGGCIPTSMGGNAAQDSVVCKMAFCSAFVNSPTCTGVSVPPLIGDAIPVPAMSSIINIAGLGSTVFQSVQCTANASIQV